MGILLLSYLVLAVAALIHSWVKTPRDEVCSSGLGMMLAGRFHALQRSRVG